MVGRHLTSVVCAPSRRGTEESPYWVGISIKFGPRSEAARSLNSIMRYQRKESNNLGFRLAYSSFSFSNSRASNAGWKVMYPENS